MVRIKHAGFAVLGMVVALAGAKAFQGMATPGVRVGAAKPVKSNLPPIAVDFRDIAPDAGLTALDVSGSESNKKYILESTGHGVVIFDFDGDGLMDVFLVNGTTFEAKTPGPTSHLYRNEGKLKFEDVTAKAGLTASGWGQGACAADYDNDGREDLFVTYYGHSVLYHNEGGTFRDATRDAGLFATATRWDTGCTFFDYDLDGKLDLAVTGYIDFDKTKVPEPGATGNCQWKGLAVMCGPRGLPPARNHLFHNEGGGKFRDVSESSGLGKQTGCYGFTVTSSDFDGDGFPDLYVACDSTPSLLYRNRKNGTFEEAGIASGVALNEDGHEQAGMGVAVADYDEDGFPDIAKTNFSDDVPNLYHNDGSGNFSDTVYASGLAVHSQYLGWGIHFLDVDHDGLKELLVVNGHVYPDVDRTAMDTRFRQPRLLYWNIGGGKFQDISSIAGPGISATWSSRGSAIGDLDNDGSIEVVVSNLGARPSLLVNSAPSKNWLLVRLSGTSANRSAIGARATVFFGSRQVSGEVLGSSSFLSQSDPRLHFGAGDAEACDKIVVRWPGGATETFPGAKVNQIIKLRQGTGRR